MYSNWRKWNEIICSSAVNISMQSNYKFDSGLKKCNIIFKNRTTLGTGCTGLVIYFVPILAPCVDSASFELSKPQQDIKTRSDILCLTCKSKLAVYAIIIES